MNMTLEIEKLGDACTACMACYNICPKNAINIEENLEGFYFPAIDHTICDNCKLCDSVCPELEENREKLIPEVQKSFYGWHNDDKIRLNSSSGGIFTAFSEKIIDSNGIVYGAAYDRELERVMHKSTEEVVLDELRRSKYAQSHISKSFCSVKKELNTKRQVLFVGTPCQISGLKKFLKKDYENLFTCDFICHGVPPMQLLRDHIRVIEEKYSSKHVSFNFRENIEGWSKYYFKCVLNNKKIIKPAQFDPYLNSFFKNLSLRKSCYKCKYSENQHHSDLTIADYWGYRMYNANIYDDRGLSLLIVNTEKGVEFINSLSKDKVTLNPLDWKHSNYVFKKRTTENYNIERRNEYFSYYTRNGYKRLISEYKLSGSYKAKIKYKLKLLLKFF